MFDYIGFKADVKNATISSFLKLLDIPDLYGFGLFSDENCETMLPVANTFTYLTSARQSYEDSECMHCKFSPEEWDFTLLSNESSFENFSKLLGKEYMIEKNDSNFEIHQHKIYSIGIEVLSELKKEEFFSKNYKGDIFLTFQASDFEFEVLALKNQIALLNSASYVNEYNDWMKTWGH